MKRYILGILIILSIYLAGCGSKVNNTYTEALGDLYITYLYNNSGTIISKNIYDANEGISTEYVYYYKPKDGIYSLTGVNIITITKDGEISGEFKNTVN